MNVEIICVGTELLLGNILNTNAKYLSEKAAELGLNLFSQSVVGDNPVRLEKQIALSMARSEIVILSGGLGPTDDDITKETVAKVMGLPLQTHTDTLKKIEKYFAQTGRVMSKNNRKQALTIKGAIVLENDHGTAPGYFVRTHNGAVILLPGPPNELVPMFENKVIPLLKKYSKGILVSHNVRVFGIGESMAAERLGNMTSKKNPTVATYAKTGEVDIRVTASAHSLNEAEWLCGPVIEKIKGIFGSHIYAVDSDSLQQTVVKMLQDRKLKLATAESCTAGMLSGRITEIPGSSEVFEMGVTAYANYIKVQALGVSEELINTKGAVCGEVAAQMAVGIRSMCNADIGVGITGVAGPGESEGKPAGLVYIAVADKKKVFVRKIMGRGSDREVTRILATSTALDMVRRYIEGREDILSFGTEIGAPIKLMEGYDLPKVETLFNADETGGKVASKTESGGISADEELMEMFGIKHHEMPEVPSEQLEIKDDSLGFVFSDDYSDNRTVELLEKHQMSFENSEDYDIPLEQLEIEDDSLDFVSADNEVFNIATEHLEIEDDSLDFVSADNEVSNIAPEHLEIENNSLDFVFGDDGSVNEDTELSGEEHEMRSENSANLDKLNEKDIKSEKPKKKGFFASIFPVKGDTVAEKIRKSIFIIAFVVLIGTMCYLVNYFVEGWIQIRQIEQAAKVWDDPESLKKNEQGIYIGFENLLQQNSDIRAWIKIDGTNINNPVYQTDNNKFYVDHDMNKQSSRYGALFIDEQAKIKNTIKGQSQNVVIYGHHMKDGTMFGPLKNYVDIDFYKKNPIIDFRTLGYEDQYKIFAIFITNANPAHDNGEVFNYRKCEFANGTEFMSWIDEVKKRSVINTNVDVIEDDYVLTLSTCTYEFDDARLVVMARRVRDGEKNPADTSNAKPNPKPLYPQIWYNMNKGAKKPVFSSKPVSSSNGNATQPDNETNSGFFGGYSSDSTSGNESDTGSNTNSGSTNSNTSSKKDNTSARPSAGGNSSTNSGSSTNGTPNGNSSTNSSPSSEGASSDSSVSSETGSSTQGGDSTQDSSSSDVETLL